MKNHHIAEYTIETLLPEKGRLHYPFNRPIIDQKI